MMLLTSLRIASLRMQKPLNMGAEGLHFFGFGTTVYVFLSNMTRPGLMSFRNVLVTIKILIIGSSNRKNLMNLLEIKTRQILSYTFPATLNLLATILKNMFAKSILSLIITLILFSLMGGPDHLALCTVFKN